MACVSATVTHLSLSVSLQAEHFPKWHFVPFLRLSLSSSAASFNLNKPGRRGAISSVEEMEKSYPDTHKLKLTLAMENDLMASDNISTANGSSVTESFSAQHFALRANSHLKSFVNCMEIQTAKLNFNGSDTAETGTKKDIFVQPAPHQSKPPLRLKSSFALSACVSLNYTVTQG